MKSAAPVPGDLVRGVESAVTCRFLVAEPASWSNLVRPMTRFESGEQLLGESLAARAPP